MLRLGKTSDLFALHIFSVFLIAIVTKKDLTTTISNIPSLDTLGMKHLDASTEKHMLFESFVLCFFTRFLYFSLI